MKKDTILTSLGNTAHKIVQVISHEGKIFGLSDSGNLYEWEHRYDHEKQKVINKWNFQISSPKYGNAQDQLLTELAKEALEEAQGTNK